MEQGVKLSKKERKELKREEEREKFKKEKTKKNSIKWLIIVLIIGLVGGGLFWVVKEFSKPLPGQLVEDQGRKHVKQDEWEKFKYNSNPPASGPHDETWVKKGIYDNPQKEGYLIHSLEHGYIIISYNCSKKFSIFNFQFSISKAFAHEEGDTLTIEEHAKEASDGAALKDSAWKSKACEDLKQQLKDIAEENRIWKLIVIPRPSLDVFIALTAWTRIEKLNTVDKEAIVRFINAFRDHGPEQTMEP